MRSLPICARSQRTLTVRSQQCTDAGHIVQRGSLGPQEPESDLGHHIFEAACANCHQYNGKGRQSVYASLIDSRATEDPTGTNLTQVVLRGANYHVKGQHSFMPLFAAGYSDAEVAAVANYVIRILAARQVK